MVVKWLREEVREGRPHRSPAAQWQTSDAARRKSGSAGWGGFGWGGAGFGVRFGCLLRRCVLVVGLEWCGAASFGKLQRKNAPLGPT